MLLGCASPILVMPCCFPRVNMFFFKMLYFRHFKPSLIRWNYQTTDRALSGKSTTCSSNLLFLHQVTHSSEWWVVWGEMRILTSDFRHVHVPSGSNRITPLISWLLIFESRTRSEFVKMFQICPILCSWSHVCGPQWLRNLILKHCSDNDMRLIVVFLFFPASVLKSHKLSSLEHGNKH